MRPVWWGVAALALVSLAARANKLDFDEDAERASEKAHGLDRDDPAARMKVELFLEGKRPAELSLEILRIAQEEADKYGLPGANSALRPFRQAARAGGSAWVNLGPSSADFSNNGGLSLAKVDSGRIRTILVHPTNPDIVYVAFAGGGVWKTFDARAAISATTGPHWHTVTESLGTLSMGALAMNPSAPESLVLGLGDPFAVKSFPGILHSEDGGATWTFTGALAGTYPSHASVFSATSTKEIKFDTTGAGGLVLACTDAGVFKAGNFGQGTLSSWSLIDLDGTTHKAQECWSVLYVGGVWLVATVDEDGNGQLFRSPDGAASFSKISSALPAPSGAPTGLGRMTLASTGKDTSATNARVYLLASDQSQSKQRDVFKSDDGGATWSSLSAWATSGHKPTNPTLDRDQSNNLTVNVQNDLDVMHNQANYNQVIVVDPNDKNTVFIGGNLSLLRSKDGGTTWSVMADWLPSAYGMSNNMYAHADWHAAAISYDGSVGKLWGGNDGGLFSSTNILTVANPSGVNTSAGCTWEDRMNRGLVTHLVYSIVSGAERPGGGTCTVSAGTRDLVYGGLQDNGTRLRGGTSGAAGSGSSPTTFNAVTGGDGFGVGAGCKSGSTAYGSLLLSTYVTNLNYSTDFGATYDASFDGTVDLPAGTLTLDPYYNFIMFVATDQADPAGGTFLVPATDANTGQGHLLYSNDVVNHGWYDIVGTLHTTGTAAGPFPNPTWEAQADGKHVGHYVVTTRPLAGTQNAALVWFTVDGSSFNGSHLSTANWTALPRVDVPQTHGVDQYLVMKSAAIDPGDAAGTTVWAGSHEAYTRCRPGGAGTSGFENYQCYPVPSTPGRVFRYNKSTSKWDAQGADGSGLPNVPVNVIKIDPGDSNTIYAGTELGLYRGTYSAGSNTTAWTRFGTGLPMVSVTDLSVSADGALVRIATYGRGFWEINTQTGGSTAGVPGDGDFDKNQRIDGFDLVRMSAVDKTTSADDTYDATGNLVGSVNAIDDADIQALKSKLGGRP
ncbi:MAG: hypothetical protein JST92_11950 [Deltaproteobacteria bacterium]|nr:hypothetical protein [Deltaproteobacteria bacterium]